MISTQRDAIAAVFELVKFTNTQAGSGSNKGICKAVSFDKITGLCDYTGTARE